MRTVRQSAEEPMGRTMMAQFQLVGSYPPAAAADGPRRPAPATADGSRAGPPRSRRWAPGQCARRSRRWAPEARARQPPMGPGPGRPPHPTADGPGPVRPPQPPMGPEGPRPRSRRWVPGRAVRRSRRWARPNPSPQPPMGPRRPRAPQPPMGPGGPRHPQPPVPSAAAGRCNRRSVRHSRGPSPAAGPPCNRRSVRRDLRSVLLPPAVYCASKHIRHGFGYD